MGIAIGIAVGIFAFEGRAGAVAACAIAGLVAGLLYGTIVGSFAALESPDPGQEPSETQHPLSEPAVDEEHEPDDPGARGADRPG